MFLLFACAFLMGFKASAAEPFTLGQIRWASCGQPPMQKGSRYLEYRCVLVNADILGASIVAGENFLFAKNVKAQLISYDRDFSKSLLTVSGHTALFNRKKGVWTIFKAKTDQEKGLGDYYFNEQTLSVDRHSI